ncbi:FixH family protein [Falsigemmobacter faecalis]|uniref:Nitrogen fixation protein FixH n=1 Tax=Falsigemmobacter faecalis TaxID=2488730 RepID=A0A3P3DSI2_9RHOB|nr:FixH family protein [Falsigemmobacter faecalis]RRH76646.1 nitrogen fixation protein FixH [Falsigemmobacter faecalis]
MTRKLTGRHVFLILLAFFGTITAVNVFMASMAISTFPGLEGKNTYNASRSFDSDRRAQVALGWQVEDAYRDGHLILTIKDGEGQPAKVKDISVLVGRATIAEFDERPVFIREGADFIAPVALNYGKWILRIEALAEDGTPFRQSRNLYVPKG